MALAAIVPGTSGCRDVCAARDGPHSASTLDDAMVDLSEYHYARILRFLEFRACREFAIDAEQAAFIAELDLAEGDLPGIVRFSVTEAEFLAANDNLCRLRRSD